MFLLYFVNFPENGVENHACYKKTTYGNVSNYLKILLYLYEYTSYSSEYTSYSYTNKHKCYSGPT